MGALNAKQIMWPTSTAPKHVDDAETCIVLQVYRSCCWVVCWSGKLGGREVMGVVVSGGWQWVECVGKWYGKGREKGTGCEGWAGLGEERGREEAFV